MAQTVCGVIVEFAPDPQMLQMGIGFTVGHRTLGSGRKQVTGEFRDGCRFAKFSGDLA